MVRINRDYNPFSEEVPLLPEGGILQGLLGIIGNIDQLIGRSTTIGDVPYPGWGVIFSDSEKNKAEPMADAMSLAIGLAGNKSREFKDLGIKCDFLPNNVMENNITGEVARLTSFLIAAPREGIEFPKKILAAAVHDLHGLITDEAWKRVQGSWDKVKDPKAKYADYQFSTPLPLEIAGRDLSPTTPKIPAGILMRSLMGFHGFGVDKLLQRQKFIGKTEQLEEVKDVIKGKHLNNFKEKEKIGPKIGIV